MSLLRQHYRFTVTPISAATRTETQRAFAEAMVRLVAMLRSVDFTTQVTPQWCVADVVGHIAIVLTGFTGSVRGHGDQVAQLVPENENFHERLAGTNANTLALVPRAEPDVMIERLESHAQLFLACLATCDPQAASATPWYGPGVTRTPDTLTALALGEVSIHGYDIAKATGASWVVPADDARIIAAQVFPEMMPLLVAPAAADWTLSYEIRLRGGVRYMVRLEGGVAAVDEVRSNFTPDCVIAADPLAFVLIGYGRSSLRSALLRGKVTAWGRHPVAATKFTKAFLTP